MRVAVVGGGPAGSFLAYHLARDGASVTVFDASHPREKPCGGGLTARTLAILPPAPESDPLPARSVLACRFESAAGEGVDVPLPRAMAVASRMEFDSWLLRRAQDQGVRHKALRVLEVRSDRTIVTGGGSEGPFDLVVGADGANSLVRRVVLPPVPASRRFMALGWFAPGQGPMLVRFAAPLEGYLWLFPRRDHVGVGICAPLGQVPSPRLVQRLEAEVSRSFPALSNLGAGRYAHTIPSPSEDPASILEIAWPGFALVGDAAALADPLTGEGIYFALRSGEILAQTLREESSCESYPERVLEDFGRELLKAACLKRRFFTPKLERRMISFCKRSGALRRVLAELVLGEQGYLSLKDRLMRTLPTFLFESLLSAFS